MTAPEFKHQMERLISAWPHSYPEERIGLIFSEISDLPISWMIRTVDQFIGRARSAPLVPEFRAEAEKKRRFQAQADQPHNLAADDPRKNSIFSDADASMMLDMTRKKMNGRVSPEEWKAFTEWVETTAALSPQRKDPRWSTEQR